MSDFHDDLNIRCAELEKRLKEAEQKALYYQKIARQSGSVRLRETEMLSRLIEDHKRSEEELRKANIELKDTQIQLLQAAKLASLGELSAGMAHELNQPLMVIRTTVQLMLRSFSKKQTDFAIYTDQFQKIERNTTRMMNIINHLRTFSRQASSDFVPLDINRIIEDSLLMIREQLRLKSIIVEKYLTPGLPQVCGNGNQLEQVFINLITNARDAIIEKSAADMHHIGKLEIITQSGKSDIKIRFRDNGCGIPEDIRQKIFDPFFTTKEVGKGTGLGLSISYGIIREHSGTIDIEETSSAGTVFRITLPLCK